MSNAIRKSKMDVYSSVLEVTKLWAELRSKDPTTKVGACVYDPTTGGLYLGYNGFPPGVPDYEHVWARVEKAGEDSDATKYEMVVHAENNAVRKALVSGVELSSAVLICTHHPCERCMKDIIAPCGIKTIFYNTDQYRSFTPRAQSLCQYIAHHCGISLQRI